MEVAGLRYEETLAPLLLLIDQVTLAAALSGMGCP